MGLRTGVRKKALQDNFGQTKAKLYVGFKLQDVVYRPNALKILHAPSLLMGKRYYPQGENK